MDMFFINDQSLSLWMSRFLKCFL